MSRMPWRRSIDCRDNHEFKAIIHLRLCHDQSRRGGRGRHDDGRSDGNGDLRIHDNGLRLVDHMVNESDRRRSVS